jgi:hypothetical protein
MAPRQDLLITMMILDPVMPNFTNFITFVSFQKPTAVLCGVAGNVLAGGGGQPDFAHSNAHGPPSGSPQTARIYIRAPV